MSGNTLSRSFTVTTFGESHGPGLGCIIDGCPPGLELDQEDMEPDGRRPGQGDDGEEDGGAASSGHGDHRTGRRSTAG